MEYEVNDKDDNGRDCFGIKVSADAAKFTNIIIAGFEK